MKKVCVVGVGLIGGSLGMALRRAGYKVSGLGRSQAQLRQAKKLKAVDSFSVRPDAVIPEADIVVLASPVQTMNVVAQQIKPFLKKGAIVTDVGSVKANILSGINVSFVGGHPLAGSEQSGVEHASPVLFKGALTVLTTAGAPAQAVETITKMWKAVGAVPLKMPAAEHDRVVALTSHLPHLISFALFDLVARVARQNKHVKTLKAGSFQDMTRIAASDATVWTGIRSLNKTNIKRAVSEFKKTLDGLINSSDSTFFKQLKKISTTKQQWEKNKS